MSMQPSPPMFSAADNAATAMSDAMALVARLLMGYLFLSSGWGKFMNMAGAVGYFTNLGVWYPGFWYWPVVGLELLIGAALVLGIATRYAALATAAFAIIATAIAHRYWQYPAAAQGGQFVQFTKNLAITGGALLLFVTGAGRFSLDNWLRKR